MTGRESMRKKENLEIRKGEAKRVKVSEINYRIYFPGKEQPIDCLATAPTPSGVGPT